MGGEDSGGERTFLHLADQVLVEHALRLLVQRAIDGHNITLPQHLLQSVHPPAPDLLLYFGLEWLVIEVQQLLAFKRLQSSQDPLADPAYGNGTDDLVLEIVLALGHASDVPAPVCDLLVRGYEITDQDEDGHDGVFCHRDHIRASDFDDGDTAIGLVGSVEIDMVRTDAGSDGELEFFGLGQALGGQVARVESMSKVAFVSPCPLGSWQECPKVVCI